MTFSFPARRHFGGGLPFTNADKDKKMNETTKHCVEIGRTAANSNYLIERVDRHRVALCGPQGEAWITIIHDASLDEAVRFGFNPESPSVLAVFRGIEQSDQ